MDDSSPPMNSHQAHSTPMISGDHTDVYRLIADSTWDWELWLGPDDEVGYISPSCERITGYRPAAFLADPTMLAAIVHPDDREHFANHRQHEAESADPLTLEYRIITRTGEERWLSHVCQTMQGADGRSMGRRASNRDITDRVRAEQDKDRALAELRESETRFRRRSTELEALHDVSLQLNTQPDTAKLLQLILDESVRLIEVEAGMLFLYDPERDQLYGEITTDYLTELIGMRLDRGQGLAWQAFTNRRGMTVSDYQSWADRVSMQPRRPLLSNLLAVPLLGKNEVLGVLDLASEKRAFTEKDIWLAEMFAAQATVALENARLIDEVQRQAGEMTALASDNAHLLEAERQQYQQLQESQTQMVRVEKMAALGRMAAALAHEINNPLQAIQSHVELVMDFPLPPNQQVEFLAVVRAEMARLTEIVQRVLDFSRPALASRQAVAIDDLIQRTLVLAGKQLQRHAIQVATAVESGLAVAVGRDQMVQVFLNLVINAVEAIGSNGCIEIKADGQDGYARIAFANDGPCIPAEHLPHLFEPFYTTKPDGTGLGLAVSQNLVAQYGGEIAVANCIDGPGVVFTVRLPLMQAT